MKNLGKLFCLSLVVIQMMAVPVAGKNKSMKVERNHKNSYVRTTITWSYNDEKVKSSEAVQSHSGIFVQEKEAKRVLAGKKMHKWSCKTGFYLGVDTPLGVIGYTKTWNDYGKVYKDGSYAVEWDK